MLGKTTVQGKLRTSYTHLSVPQITQPANHWKFQDEAEQIPSVANGAGVIAGTHVSIGRTYKQLGGISVNIEVLVQLQTSCQCAVPVPNGQKTRDSGLANHSYAARRYGMQS